MFVRPTPAPEGRKLIEFAGEVVIIEPQHFSSATTRYGETEYCDVILNVWQPKEESFERVDGIRIFNKHMVSMLKEAKRLSTTLIAQVVVGARGNAILKDITDSKLIDHIGAKWEPAF